MMSQQLIQPDCVPWHIPSASLSTITFSKVKSTLQVPLKQKLTRAFVLSMTASKNLFFYIVYGAECAINIWPVHYTSATVPKTAAIRFLAFPLELTSMWTQINSNATWDHQIWILLKNTHLVIYDISILDPILYAPKTPPPYMVGGQWSLHT